MGHLTLSSYFLTLAVTTLLTTSRNAAEMLQNPSFEATNLGHTWNCYGCRLSLISQHGQKVLSVTDRTHDYQGPGQNVQLRPDTRYLAKMKVKQINDLPGKMYQTYKLSTALTHANGKTDYPDVAQDRGMHSSRGWVEMSGYFHTPSKDISNSRLYLQGPDPGVEFLVDDASLTLVANNENWKAEADQRIEQIRKSDIHVRVDLPSHVSPADLEVQIQLKKHAFPFGTSLTYDLVLDPGYKHYRDLLYSMFNWATLASYYWKYSHGTRGHLDYSGASNAIVELRKRGMHVRGHNIYWGVESQNPDWVLPLSGAQLRQAVDQRLDNVMKATKGKLDHWDVNNELLHGHFYEEKTGDRDYSKKLFAKVHRDDPSVKLFLNDYSVVTTGDFTEAYVEQANAFKRANVGLYGLGVQCHMTPYMAPDPVLMKYNLDQLATTGLPLWATELDVVAHDENTRADWYDTTLRVLFSHPSVEGIILWGFWGPKHWRGEDAALVSGDNYLINAAGKRFLDLTKREWSTDVTRKLSQGTNFVIRGFHGDYDVIVKYKGQPIKLQTFTLGKHGSSVHVTVPDNHAAIAVSTTTFPDTVLTHEHHVDFINEHTIGRATSGHSRQLTCVTRWSGFSEVADDKFAEISCQSDEVLTGCASQSEDSRDQKDGEMIHVAGGKVFCRAYNGGHATSPVQASARCCKLTGLQCDYRQSGPSRDLLDEQIETRCARGNQFATGCAAHNFYQALDGTFSTAHACIAQNKGKEGHVESYAVCCSAPKMTCKVKASAPTGLQFKSSVTVACDRGWTALGCNAVSEDSGIGVVYIGNSGCTAVNGREKQPGEEGVVAHVVCCKV